MRHGKKNNHLSRKKAHREALLSNMACSLIEHKRINTTLAKAKALRVYVEPLLTKSKTDTTHSRRVVFSYLKNKEAASELFKEIAPKISDRPGGYTRIIKLNNRLGDNSEMAIIELVDYNELLLADQEAPKKKTRRRGGKSKPAAQTTKETSSSDEIAVEEESIEEIQDAVEVVEDTVEELAKAPAETTEAVETQDKENEESSEEESDVDEKDKKE